MTEKDDGFVVFSNDNSKMLWLEEQLRIMWEVCEELDIADEVDKRIKEELDINDYLEDGDN